MAKKDVHLAVTIIFASVLSICALTGGNTELPEIRQVEDSIRNLRRADNLWISYSYTISDKNETVTTRTDIWADQLTSSWVAEYYTTDADGTRMYLKRYCDGMDIYTRIDWNGEWAKQTIGGNTEVPYLDSIVTINYGSEDMQDIEGKQQGDFFIISYALTPEYLASVDEKNQASMEIYYENYNMEEASMDTDENLYMTLEQSRQMRLADTLIVYKIDKYDVLRSGTYSYNVFRPEIITEEDGDTGLGEEEKVQNLIEFQIRDYNKDFILDKIEQYASEII